jgi:hypothetical protein
MKIHSNVSRAVIALILFCGGWQVLSFSPTPLPTDGPLGQSSSQRSAADYQVVFEFTESGKELGGSTDDQLTVVFSNRSVEGVAPPVPFFGEDILQEFSFSGSSFVKNQLRFSRRVRDKSFVDARYIRVINHGVDMWAGDRISLTVDGEAILRGVGMMPRRRATGQNPRGGIEKFNPKDWAMRSYWEAELQQYRGASRK